MTRELAVDAGVAVADIRRNDARWGAALHARRVWAIGAIHADAPRLTALHDALADRIEPGDAVVYLGNYIGHGTAVSETVGELLRFRCAFLSRPPFVHAGDLVYLRGQQEEMWQKLLQLQFAVNPADVLRWMLEQGVEATLRAYGGDVSDAINATRAGPIALARWAETLRGRMRRAPGHMALFNALYRTAWTAPDGALFVHAGFDPKRGFTEQTDGFWWDSAGFEDPAVQFEQFHRVIRGYDPAHSGYAESLQRVTVDGGCGFGGALLAVCFDPAGAVLERLSS
jgi:serine/threonine protein phosphatase 1